MQHFKYVFHSDPGHGWLEVPRAELKSLGIHKTISTCSYQRGSMVYLEEDCDASKFIQAYRAKYGKNPVWVEKHQDPTPIRNYERYSLLSC